MLTFSFRSWLADACTRLIFIFGLFLAFFMLFSFLWVFFFFKAWNIENIKNVEPNT